MKGRVKVQSVVLASALVLCTPLVARAQTKPATAGFNLFSVEQDIEIGRQSAVEAERQLPLLKNRNVDRYLNQIVSKLAAQAPGARYPYAIKAVNDSSINAFALPGGPMYVNRGLFEAARSESELASVLAHEMAHVALRHGTHQASKAYLSQAGLGILGGLLGKNGGNTAQIVNAVGGLGLNAVFLKFGRDAEYQADQVGAEIMAGAGYSPVAMADFFGLLRSEQGRDPGKVEQFFSDHPATSDREARIREKAGNLQLARSRDVGGFDRMRADLRRLSPASPRAAAVGGATEPGQPQLGERSVRSEGGPAVHAVPEVRTAQRLLQHRVPRQLAGLRVRLRIRGFHGARRGCRRHGERSAGHALRGDPQPLRALRGGNGPPARKPEAQLCALRGHRRVAREPRGRH